MPRSVLAGLTPNQNNSKLLYDVDFDHGLGGFVQLIDGVQPIGFVGLDTDITYGGSRHSMVLGTEDYPWGAAAGHNWSACTGLKRMTRSSVSGRIKVDTWWAWGSVSGQNAPRGFRIGLDQADPSGNRNYFMVQWLNWDDNDTSGSGAGTRVTKWQVLCDKSGTGGATKTFVDVPGATMDFGYNEHKRNQIHTEVVVDEANKVYDGLRVNGRGFGSLTDGDGDPLPIDAGNPLRALGSPLAESLSVFKNGRNVCYDVVNRLNVASSKARLNVTRSKAVLL